MSAGSAARESAADEPRGADAGLEPSGYAQRAALLEQLLARHAAGLAVAFSGGVDSAVLLHAATRVLGARAVGVLADSPSLPRLELERARDFAQRIGARLVVVTTQEGQDTRYTRNDALRCYWCKGALFEAMGEVVAQLGLEHIAYGENLDDDLDERPGRRAAGERGVLAPLAQAGFRKADVRHYAREAGLELAEKPASACLASRIPRGVEVTPERLARVEAAEAAVAALGFRVLRVRHRGALARLEVGAEELPLALERELEIGACLRSVGFERHELASYLAPAERSSSWSPGAGR